MGRRLDYLWNGMTRTKKLQADILDTKLKRCLSSIDLAFIGIGNMAGPGIFMLTGTIVRDKTGPAAFIAFLIAGLAAFLNSLCYAELGSRIPKAGSAYSYTYITAGEFLAFIIGWSMVLEYTLLVSSVARGWSGTLDSILNKTISKFTKETFFKNFTAPVWMGDYPDFLSFLIVFLLGAIIATGPRMSANFNAFITSITITVIIFTASLMLYHPYEGGKYFSDASHGGFLPFGFSGVLSAAGTCFYSYIGFDAITVSSEEASNPKRDLPLATVSAVSIVTFMVVVSSLSLVLFLPWYEVDRTAAFPSALRVRGFHWASYITGVGSLIGYSACLFTSMYALPRVVYSMANDGLLPTPLAIINEKTQTPLVSLTVFGLMAAILATLLSVEVQADCLSIGSLMAYSIVCVNVCILRYSELHLLEEEKSIQKSSENESQSVAYFKNIPILRNIPPTKLPVMGIITMIFILTFLCLLLLYGENNLLHGEIWAIGLVIILVITLIIVLLIINLHKQNINFDSFKVPFVPLLPCLCLFLNITLILKLSYLTWLRFILWSIIGFILYFGYGLSHSHENSPNEKTPLLPLEPAKPPEN